jgi:tetratricopeptide (TPR) repeat protein
MPRWLWFPVGLVLIAGSAYAAFRVVNERHVRAELALAEAEFNRGLTGSARRRLISLEAAQPGNAEVEFRLGVCEMTLGRPDAAVTAWLKVPAGSRFATLAAVRRASLLITAGRYTPAETLLQSVRAVGGPDGFEAHEALVRLFALEGRDAEALAVLEDEWSLTADRGELLNAIWRYEMMVPPYDRVRHALNEADQDDDRVWLGLANLEIDLGHFAEASGWLERCQRRRPDDHAVWRAALELAQKTDDLAGFQQALRHLFAARFSRGEILSLRAWLAGRVGDRGRERQALVDLLAYEPKDAKALERLAELDVEEGRSAEAAERRKRKKTIDLAKEPLRQLYVSEGDFRGRALELARTAETLGRRFQARGWALIVLERQPAHPEARAILARLQQAEPPVPLPTTTLAAAVDDASRRPARPHALVRGPTTPRFVDDAETAGLRFVYDNGQSPFHQLPETMAGGVALFDYDGDGWLDVYVVQGGPFGAELSRHRPGDRLFRNTGDGRFADVTADARLGELAHGYSLGVAVGDYDNDGVPDLFISRLQSYLLLRNRGDGTFEDTTEAAGLAGKRDNPTSAAFADLDGDGDLDLYVCHYMVWDPTDLRLCQKEDGEYYYCDPSKVDAAPDHVFRNDDGRFVDITRAAGFVDPDGRGLGVVAAHLDDDDQIDLFVANDGTANYLFHNQGGGRFEETALVAGVAGNAEGGYQAGMGVACGDLDGDGRADLAVTNFYGQSTTLFHNLGGGMFADWTSSSGMGVATRYLLGFGITFCDYDNDGRLDVLSANGNVNDARPNHPYAMPVQLLAGTVGGRWMDVSQSAGPPWDVLRVGRGLADGDLDNDGKVDALIVPLNEPVAYFHNHTAGGHFITLELVGTRSNRDAVGARMTLTTGGRRQFAQRFGGGSYQSARDGRQHLGVGPATRVDSIEVRWPSGRVERHEGLETDRAYVLREGERRARPRPAETRHLAR